MSAAVEGIPGTTARAVAVVGLVAALVVAGFEPIAGLGALAGGLLAGGVLGTGASPRRLFVSGAVTVTGVAGAIGALWITTSRGVATVALGIPMVVLGASIVVSFAGGLPAVAVRRLPAAGLYTALVAGATAVGWLAVVEGWALLAAWFATTTAGSLVAATMVVGVLVVAGVLAVPVASVARPATRETVTRGRNALTVVVGALAVVLAVGLTLAPLFGPTAAVVAFLTESPGVRLGVAVVGFVGVVTLAVGGFLRLAHEIAALSGFEHVAVVAGAALGAGLTAGATHVAATASFDGGLTVTAAVATVLGATAVVCLAGAVVASTYRSWLSAGTAPGVSTTTALALLGCGLAVGATDAAGWSPAPGWPHLVALVAIAAGLVVYRAGRVGRDVVASVGPDNATRRPQLVHLGWTGAVAGVGLLVAAAGYWVAAVVAPTLSVPATLGAIGGLAAVSAGAWLLLR